MMNVQLAARRKFFDSYGSRPGEQSADPPPGGVKFACPCCGYPTLFDRAGYDICELCWWEDDGQDDKNADKVFGGPNKNFSLTDARQNFEVHLVMYPPEEDTRIGGPDSEETKNIKRALMFVFSKMMTEPAADELNELWKEVMLLERDLRGTRS